MRIKQVSLVTTPPLDHNVHSTTTMQQANTSALSQDLLFNFIITFKTAEPLINLLPYLIACLLMNLLSRQNHYISIFCCHINKIADKKTNSFTRRIKQIKSSSALMQLLENQQNSYPVYVSSKYDIRELGLSFVICFRNIITKGKIAY